MMPTLYIYIYIYIHGHHSQYSAGTPVSGSTNKFDYSKLSSVTLTCMVDYTPSGTVTYLCA